MVDNRTTGLAQWKIHPIFHASLLTPYVETDSHGPNFSHPPPDLIKGKNEYEVETIRKHRRFGRNKKLQYLLKWRGYPESDNMWEPVEQLHAPQLLKEYHTCHPLESTKAILIQHQTHCLFPTSACLHSCHLSAAHAVHSLPPITATSSSTSSYSTQRVDSTSVLCALNASNTAAGSISTSPTHMSSTPQSSTVSDPNKAVQSPHWLSSTSRSTHSLSILYSPLTTKTRRSFSVPYSASPRSLPINSTSSTLIGSITTLPGVIPSSIRPSAKNATAIIMTESPCPHYIQTSASNARSAPEPFLGGLTYPLTSVLMIRAAHADSPA